MALAGGPRAALDIFCPGQPVRLAVPLSWVREGGSGQRGMLGKEGMYVSGKLIQNRPMGGFEGVIGQSGNGCQVIDRENHGRAGSATPVDHPSQFS